MNTKIIGFDCGANAWQVISDGRYAPTAMERKFEEWGCKRDSVYAISDDGKLYLMPDGKAGNKVFLKDIS